jgi:hypothetical protein
MVLIQFCSGSHLIITKHFVAVIANSFTEAEFHCVNYSLGLKSVSWLHVEIAELQNIDLYVDVKQCHDFISQQL